MTVSYVIHQHDRDLYRTVVGRCVGGGPLNILRIRPIGGRFVIAIPVRDVIKLEV